MEISKEDYKLITSKNIPVSGQTLFYILKILEIGYENKMYSIGDLSLVGSIYDEITSKIKGSLEKMKNGSSIQNNQNYQQNNQNNYQNNQNNNQTQQNNYQNNQSQNNQNQQVQQNQNPDQISVQVPGNNNNTTEIIINPNDPTDMAFAMTLKQREEENRLLQMQKNPGVPEYNSSPGFTNTSSTPELPDALKPVDTKKRPDMGFQQSAMNYENLANQFSNKPVVTNSLPPPQDTRIGNSSNQNVLPQYQSNQYQVPHQNQQTQQTQQIQQNQNRINNNPDNITFKNPTRPRNGVKIRV
jgi:hypothetical protein